MGWCRSGRFCQTAWQGLVPRNGVLAGPAGGAAAAMKLTVGDKSQDNPTQQDIEQAVEMARRGGDDIIALEAGDEYLEALQIGRAHV